MKNAPLLQRARDFFATLSGRINLSMCNNNTQNCTTRLEPSLRQLVAHQSWHAGQDAEPELVYQNCRRSCPAEHKQKACGFRTTRPTQSTAVATTCSVTARASPRRPPHERALQAHEPWLTKNCLISIVQPLPNCRKDGRQESTHTCCPCDPTEKVIMYSLTRRILALAPPPAPLPKKEQQSSCLSHRKCPRPGT